MKRKLFGTNGIRGIVNEDMTSDLALRVGLAVGTFIDGGMVVIGRDARLSGPMLESAITSGLCASGCRVLDIGLAPTPAVEFIVKQKKAKAGIAVTASHNPPEFNGIKIMDSDGIELPREKEEAIEKIIFEQRFKLKPWMQTGMIMHSTGWVEDYVQMMKHLVDVDLIRKRKFNVLVDPANSVGTLVTPRLLQELGCRVHTVNAHIDGSFPARLPEPTPSTLKTTCSHAQTLGVDLAVAHDGDADRSIFIDEKGQVVLGDRTFALIAKGFLRKHPGETVVTPLSTSEVVRDVVEKAGGKLDTTPVGSIHVSRRMVQLNALLGGEENGGIFYGPHLPVRDGAMACALMLEVLAETGKPLSQLLSELPPYYVIKDKLPCPENRKEEVLQKLQATVQDSTGQFWDLHKPDNVDLRDGVKIRFPQGGWILIRPSGTEPIYRIFAESTDPEKAEELVSRYKRQIADFIKG